MLRYMFSRKGKDGLRGDRSRQLLFFITPANRTRENLRLRIDKTPINGHEIKSVKKQAPCPH
jgi:hypothetical protein